METIIKEKTATEYFVNLESYVCRVINQKISLTAKAPIAYIGRVDNEYFVARNYFAFTSFITCCCRIKSYNINNKGTIYEIFKYKTKSGAVKKLEIILNEKI